jgi:proto-oncogene C-crk
MGLFLSFQKGEIIIVTKMNSNGLWEGEVNGKKGMFPFTHVKFLEDNSEDGT